MIEMFKRTKIGGRKYVANMRTRKFEDNKYLDEKHNTLKDYLLVLYQVRCNFFHGEKIPSDQDDNRTIEWAYKYFYLFWKSYLEFID